MRDQSLSANRATGADAQERRERLDQGVAEGQTAIAGRDDLQEVARIALAGPGKAPIQDQSGGQAARRRREQQLPPVQHFGDFHQIALMPERDLFERVGATKEDEVDQAADDAHAPGEQQMQGFFAEPELLANAEQFPPMPLEKI